MKVLDIIVYIVKIMWWGLKRISLHLAVQELYRKALKVKIKKKVELGQVTGERTI